MSSNKGARKAASALGIVTVMVPNLLFPAGKLPRLLDDCRGQLVVGHIDIVLLADLGNDETEPHPSLGYGAVFFARLFLGRVLRRRRYDSRCLRSLSI